MTRLPYVLLLTGIGLASWFSATTEAKELPSFDTEQAAWNATHVVVASEGEVIDGRLDVLESWKGDLKAGHTIEIAELKQFLPVAARSIDRRFTFNGDRRAGIPQVVSCQRMVLFLVRNQAADGKESPVWQSAITIGPHRLPMTVSVAWLEGEEAFAVQQPENPGPALLMPLTRSAKEFRTFVEQVISRQREMGEIANEDDRGLRAAGYRRHVEAKSFFVRTAAFHGISQCGDAAIPVLRDILKDEALIRVHGEAVKSLAQTKGIDAVPILVELIDGELTFWKETAPGLPVGWWNGTGGDAIRQEYLRSRYGRVVQAVFALDRNPDPRAAEVVTNLRDFWRSLPQLDDRSGLNQISESCTSQLKKLSRNRQQPGH